MYNLIYQGLRYGIAPTSLLVSPPWFSQSIRVSPFIVRCSVFFFCLQTSTKIRYSWRGIVLTGVRVPYSRPAGMTSAIYLSLSEFSQIRAFWDPGLGYRGCVIHAPRMHLVAMSVATMGAYAVLLITMLLGLLRQRPERSYGVWDMLCQQVRVYL
jgi:hypothetical protein